jgi:iron complex outermembrane recepter protein
MGRRCARRTLPRVMAALVASVWAANALATGLSTALSPQSLADALDVFSRATGYQVIYRADLAAGLSTQGADAGLSAIDTLRQLLRGTGLGFKFINDRTIAIVKLPASDSSNPAPPGKSARPAEQPPPTSDAGAPDSAATDSSRGAKDVRHRGFWGRITGLFTLCGSLAAAGGACAQDEAGPGMANGSELQEVVVTGIRASLQRAMDIKRDADTVVDSISAEDLGKFPDENVAESLQRITGVSIDRNQVGEGQTVTIRGFGADFNTVLVDGRQLPTQTGHRSFDFDTLPADLINGADVYKTSSSSQDDGGIGGLMNLHTPRPLDLKHFTAIASLKGEKDDISGSHAEPQGFVLLSDTFADGTFGALGSLSVQERSAPTNSVSTGNWVTADFPLLPGDPHGFMPQQLDVESLDAFYRRIGGHGVLQWKPNDQLLMTVDGLYDKYEIHSESSEIGFYFDPTQIASGTFDKNGVLTNFTTTDQQHTDFIREHQNANLLSPSLLKQVGYNAKWNSSDNQFIATLDLDVAKNTVDGGTSPRYFTVAGFDNVVTYTGNGGVGLPSITTSGVPSLGIPGQTYTDPNLLKTHFIQEQAINNSDQINEGHLDLQWNAHTSVLQDLRSGLYFQNRILKADTLSSGGNSQCAYCGYNTPAPASLFSTFNGPSSLGGYGSSLPGQWLSYDPGAYIDYLLTPAAMAAEDAALGKPSGYTYNNLYTGGADGFLPTNGTSAYAVTEKVEAFYVQFDLGGTLAGLPWSGNIGGRYVHTKETSHGYSQVLEDLLPIQGDPTAYNPLYADNGQQLYISASHSYNNFLPSLNFKLNLTDQIIARAAVSRSLTRPDMYDLRPVIGYNVLRPGELQASGGNPDLKPYLSDNYDLSLEWYFSQASYASIGGFRKNIKDFVSNEYYTLPVHVANSAGLAAFPGGVADFLFNAPTNSQSAYVEGLELALQHTLNWLPWPLDGLGFNANATFMHSNAQLNAANTSSNFALTGLGNSQNFIVFYEKGPASVRFAYNYRDTFLSNTAPVTYTKGYGQLDAQASYKVTDNVLVTFAVANITNAVQQEYDRYLNEFDLLNEFGRRYSAGVRVNF